MVHWAMQRPDAPARLARARAVALLDELDVELLSRVLSFLSPAPLLMLRRTLPRNARGRLLRGARRKVRAQTINVQRSTLPPRASPPPWFAVTDREAASAAGLGRARHAAAARQVRLDRCVDAILHARCGADCGPL